MMAGEQAADAALPRALALAREEIACGVHVGLQLYVSLNGRVVADAALGLAGPGVEMTSKTLVPWLSAGKPLTALALARLWERGVLDVDDPVAHYVPEFGQNGKGLVRLRHLLTHTTGLAPLHLDWTRRPWTEMVAAACAAPLLAGAIPGSHAAYEAQAGWFVLGEVIRRASGGGGASGAEPGTEFANILAREVFERLGMRATSMGLSLERQAASQAQMPALYETSPNVTDVPRPAPWETPDRIAAISPGGGARGPIRELGRFYEMLLRKGTLEAAAGEGAVHAKFRLLRAPTVEAMVARQRYDMVDATFRHKVDWGFGFLIDSNCYGVETVPYGYGRHSSPRTFGHGGMQSSTAFCDPEHGLVVAAFFNGLPGEARHSRRVRDFNTLLYEDLGLGSGAPMPRPVALRR